MSDSVAVIGRGLFVLVAVALMAASAPGKADPLAVAWDQKIEVVSGNGHKGPWRMNRSNFDFVDDPTVAITEQGAVAVAWADQPRLDIFFQLYGPNGKTRLAEPVNVSGNPGTFSWLPRLAFAPGDASQVYLLWQEIVFSGGSHGGEIFFARSTDGGRSFEAAINLSNSVPGDGKGRLNARYWHNGSLDLAVGPQGDLYAAWTEYEGRLWLSRSANRGASFSDPLLVYGGNGKPARAPALATGPAGAVHLAWTVGEDPAADIHLASSADGGRSFGAPRIAVRSAGHADAPKIALDGKGSLHLVYGESPAGPFERYQIRYTRLDEGAEAFEPPQTISNRPTTQIRSTHFPSLGLDAMDNLYVAWELFPRQIGYSRGLGFTASRDGGRSFPAPSIIPGSLDPALGVNGSQQGLLMRKLAVNGAGAIAVVNSTFKRNESSRIWLTRGQAAKVGLRE